MSTQTLSSVRCGTEQFELPACVEREYITWFGVRNSGLQCLRGNDHAKVCFDFGGGVADLGCDGLQADRSDFDSVRNDPVSIRRLRVFDHAESEHHGFDFKIRVSSTTFVKSGSAASMVARRNEVSLRRGIQPPGISLAHGNDGRGLEPRQDDDGAREAPG